MATESTGLLAQGERRGLMNVVILGISFCALFVAFSPTQSMQTNFNADVGFRSLSILYLVFTFSNLISPYVVQAVGEKFALMIGAVCYIVFIAANIKIVDPILYVASAINGFGAAVIWTAQGSVVLHSAPAAKLGAYNGIFFGIFQWAQVIGNLLAGILANAAESKLFLVLTIVGSTSLIGFLFVRGSPKDEKKEAIPVTERLGQTFKIMIEKPMIMLYLAMIYSGLSQTYMFGVFPKPQPKSQVGYILACFGAADVAGSFFAGYISDKLGRLPVILTGAVSMTIATTIFYLQSLHAITDQTYVSYIIGILLGIADAGFNTQLYATLGEVFPDRVEAAIGAYKFFQAGSTAVMFFVGPYIHNQLFWFAVTNGFLWSGTILYFILYLTIVNKKGYKPITVNDAEH